MTSDANLRAPGLRSPPLRSQKRGDLVVEEIKRWIAERRLGPGDKLPKEDELQTLFGVSKGTAREALKSLEVQGLVTVSTGPAGGATRSLPAAGSGCGRRGAARARRPGAFEPLTGQSVGDQGSRLGGRRVPVPRVELVATQRGSHPTGAFAP
jgi:DNA-binding transcriptional MocR family regulator